MKNLLIGTTFILSLSQFSCVKKVPKEPTFVEPPLNTELRAGATETPKKLNGYLYMSANTSANSTTTSVQAFITGFASFADPAKNLMRGFDRTEDRVMFNNNDMGNVSVGEVTHNGSLLSKSTFSPVNVSYHFNGSSQMFNFAPSVWNIEGNGSFTAFEQTLLRAFPKIIHSALTNTISKSQDLVINIPSIMSDYDSVIVVIEGNFSNRIKKSVASPATTITIKSTELALAFNSQSSGNIQYMAFNFSNRIINDKVYVFELGCKANTYVQIYP